jgi:hypothetical protein
MRVVQISVPYHDRVGGSNLADFPTTLREPVKASLSVKYFGSIRGLLTVGDPEQDVDDNRGGETNTGHHVD